MDAVGLVIGATVVALIFLTGLGALVGAPLRKHQPPSAEQVWDAMPEQTVPDQTESITATLIDGAQVLNRSLFGPGNKSTVYYQIMLVKWEDGTVSLGEASYHSSKGWKTLEPDQVKIIHFSGTTVAHFETFIALNKKYTVSHPYAALKPIGTKRTAMLRDKLVAEMAASRAVVTSLEPIPTLKINGQEYAYTETVNTANDTKTLTMTDWNNITTSGTMVSTASSANTNWAPVNWKAFDQAAAGLLANQKSQDAMVESAVDPTPNPKADVPADIIAVRPRVVPDLNCFCGHRLTSHVQNTGPTESGLCVLPGCACEQWRRGCAECGALSYPWRLSHTAACVRGRGERAMLTQDEQLADGEKHNRPMRTSIEDIPEEF